MFCPSTKWLVSNGRELPHQCLKTWSSGSVLTTGVGCGGGVRLTPWSKRLEITMALPTQSRYLKTLLIYLTYFTNSYHGPSIVDEKFKILSTITLSHVHRFKWEYTTESDQCHKPRYKYKSPLLRQTNRHNLPAPFWHYRPDPETMENVY